MTVPSTVSLCGVATVFVLQDVLRNVEHYRDVLGFHTEFTYGQPTFYAGVERDGVVIHLQAASETKRQPGQGAVNVFVTDVDALYQELKSRGARMLNGPKDYHYGMRDFDINDLDGISLMSPPPPAPRLNCQEQNYPAAHDRAEHSLAKRGALRHASDGECIHDPR